MIIPHAHENPLSNVQELLSRAATGQSPELIYPEQTSRGLVAVLLDVNGSTAVGDAIVVKDEVLTATRFGVNFDDPTSLEKPLLQTSSLAFDELEPDDPQTVEDYYYRYATVSGTLITIVASGAKNDGIHTRKTNPGYAQEYDLGSLLEAGVPVPPAVAEAWFKVTD